MTFKTKKSNFFHKGYYQHENQWEAYEIEKKLQKHLCTLMQNFCQCDSGSYTEYNVRALSLSYRELKTGLSIKINQWNS